VSGAIPPLPQYAFMAWCSVKVEGQLYLDLYMLLCIRRAALPSSVTVGSHVELSILCVGGRGVHDVSSHSAFLWSQRIFYGSYPNTRYFTMTTWVLRGAANSSHFTAFCCRSPVTSKYHRHAYSDAFTV
jgi:hypothetical protein